MVEEAAPAAPTRAEVDARLREVSARSVGPVWGALTLALAALALLNLVPPVDAHVVALLLLDGTTTLALGVGYLLLQRRPVRPARANLALFIPLALLLVNLWISCTVRSDASGLPFVLLILLGAGVAFLTTVPYLVAAATSLVVWGIVATTYLPPAELREASFLVVAALALSVIAHVLRSRAVRDVETIRMHDERLKEALREALAVAERNEQRIRTVIDNAPVIVFSADANGIITYADGKGLAAIGLSPHETEGASAYDVYRDAPAVLDATRRALAGEEVTASIELNKAILSTTMSPTRDERGNVTGLVGVSTDITAQANAQAELQAARTRLVQSERLSSLGTLLASVAHEVNNPLTFMSIKAETSRARLQRILDSQEPLTPEARKSLAEVVANQEKLLEGVKRVGGITSALRQVARPSTAPRKLLDPARLVETALTVASPRLPRTVEVSREFADAPLVHGAESELLQVLINLLLNAGDAMRAQDKGTLRIRVGPAPDERVVVEVEDDGPGIAPEAAERLFTPFFTTKPDGTGLGLSISRGIVEAHGGRLEFESNGRGALFRVLLPSKATAG